jgi:hypothetical protein
LLNRSFCLRDVDGRLRTPLLYWLSPLLVRLWHILLTRLRHPLHSWLSMPLLPRWRCNIGRRRPRRLHLIHTLEARISPLPSKHPFQATPRAHQYSQTNEDKQCRDRQPNQAKPHRRRSPARSPSPSLSGINPLNLTSPRLLRMFSPIVSHVFNARPCLITRLYACRISKTPKSRSNHDHIAYKHYPRPHPIMPSRPLHPPQLPQSSHSQRSDKVADYTCPRYSVFGTIFDVERDVVCGGVALEVHFEGAVAHVAGEVRVQVVFRDAIEDGYDSGEREEEEERWC